MGSPCLEPKNDDLKMTIQRKQRQTKKNLDIPWNTKTFTNQNSTICTPGKKKKRTNKVTTRTTTTTIRHLAAGHSPTGGAHQVANLQGEVHPDAVTPTVVVHVVDHVKEIPVQRPVWVFPKKKSKEVDVEQSANWKPLKILKEVLMRK